jgi:hypothetical protein
MTTIHERDTRDSRRTIRGEVEKQIRRVIAAHGRLDKREVLTDIADQLMYLLRPMSGAGLEMIDVWSWSEVCEMLDQFKVDQRQAHLMLQRIKQRRITARRGEDDS